MTNEETALKYAMADVLVQAEAEPAKPLEALPAYERYEAALAAYLDSALSKPQPRAPWWQHGRGACSNVPADAPAYITMAGE